MTENKDKWTRRNLIALWDGQPYHTVEQRTANMAECDRIMIALHRFQTIGKVAYRRLLGMHGGGGGTSDRKFRDILNSKVDLDIKGHSGYDGKYPDNGYWPNPVPNATPPLSIHPDDPDRCFAYTFCWHAQPEFLLWHRPLMAEFERGLQDHDPKYNSEDTCCYNGPDALAAPYWAWEGWDGLSLPQVVANPVYVVKTNQWEYQGYPKGSIFPNPYHRWFAPVSIKDQKLESFPTTLSDGNTTTRASAFNDCGAEFDFPWEQVSIPKKPSMREVVQKAVQNENWLEFCTMNADVGSSTWSIENAHNKFHNHVGGMTKGGIQGTGTQTDPDNGAEYTGTMAQNQSIFDPIFFLHHSNVDRQLFSWQRHFASDNTNLKDCSVPSRELMSRVLYPWTKPELLFSNRLSWNTPSNISADATFGDWWAHTTLPYKYDEYLDPPSVIPSDANIIPDIPSRFFNAMRMKVYIDAKSYRGGEYNLYYTPKSDGILQLVGTVSVLSAVGSVCGQCSIRKEGRVAFEVSDTFKCILDAKNAFRNGELCLTRNDNKIKIERIIVMPWHS